MTSARSTISEGATYRMPQRSDARLGIFGRIFGWFFLAGVFFFIPYAQAGCPSGEDQCVPGFVWREAFPGDHVCVSGTTREQMQVDNSNVDKNHVSGSSQCRFGLVWREAEADDQVCVTNATRELAAVDNAAASARRDPACAEPKSASSLGVFTANLAGTSPIGGLSYETRERRLAISLARHRAVPDVIVLQELYGWLATPIVRSCGRGLGVNVGDYDMIDVLLHELQLALGVTYRVAYLTGREGGFGGFFQCRLYESQAMLYNPATLINRTKSDSNSLPHNFEDNIAGVPHLRRSLPLCNRGTHLMPLESLIDGPLVADKCSTPTPSGPAYAIFQKTGHINATIVRFSPVSDPTRNISIFNLHPTAGVKEEFDQAVASVVALMNSVLPPPFIRAADDAFPPIMAGDLNGAAIDDNFVGFGKVAEVNGSDDGTSIGMGKFTAFPTHLVARVSPPLILPDVPSGQRCASIVLDPQYLISDHCVLFVRFDRDGPTAEELRDVFVDGPDRVRQGAEIKLTAIPSGGKAPYSFLWHPGNVTSANLTSTAGSAGTSMSFTVEVTDASTKTVLARHSVNVLAPVDDTCRKSCQADRATCIANTGTPGNPSVIQCNRDYRDCLDNCLP